MLVDAFNCPRWISKQAISENGRKVWKKNNCMIFLYFSHSLTFWRRRLLFLSLCLHFWPEWNVTYVSLPNLIQSSSYFRLFFFSLPSSLCINLDYLSAFLTKDLCSHCDAAPLYTYTHTHTHTLDPLTLFFFSLYLLRHLSSSKEVINNLP